MKKHLKCFCSSLHCMNSALVATVFCVKLFSNTKFILDHLYTVYSEHFSSNFYAELPKL